jgi:hypothetical protein
MALVSGKGSGYYGCPSASRRACENKKLILRKSGWRGGARFSYYSGTPTDTTDRAQYTSLSPEPGIEVQSVRAERPSRLPAFHRLDLRFEKRWKIGNRGASWSVVFEVLNATLNQEVTGIGCRNGRGVPNNPSGGVIVVQETCSYRVLGPVTIPSIGIEGRF